MTPVANLAVTRTDGAASVNAGGPDVADTLFAMAEGEVSELLRQGDEYWVYRMVSKRPSAVPSFEEARAEVERTLLREQARERALGEARLRLEDLRRGEKPEALAARLKGRVVETAHFSQGDFVAEAGLKGEAFQAAFGLDSGSFGGPVAGPAGGVVLFRVDTRIPATREAFAPEKAAIVARLRGAKKDQLFEAWIEDLRRVRAVKINEALVGNL
jgi:parvulin-like peptidyl-prolyl isomerase